MPNYLGKLRSFLIIYYRVYAKELIAKVYAKDVKELIIYYYYYYYSRSIGRANLRFSGLIFWRKMVDFYNCAAATGSPRQYPGWCGSPGHAAPVHIVSELLTE